jgi:hypothetical protein
MAEPFAPSSERFDEVFTDVAAGRVVNELFDRVMGPFPSQVEPFSLVNAKRSCCATSARTDRPTTTGRVGFAPHACRRQAVCRVPPYSTPPDSTLPPLPLRLRRVACRPTTSRSGRARVSNVCFSSCSSSLTITWFLFGFTRANTTTRAGCASDEPQAARGLRVRHERSRVAFWRKRDAGKGL